MMLKWAASGNIQDSLIQIVSTFLHNIVLIVHVCYSFAQYCVTLSHITQRSFLSYKAEIFVHQTSRWRGYLTNLNNEMCTKYINSQKKNVGLFFYSNDIKQ